MLEANLCYVIRSSTANLITDVTQPRKRRFQFILNWIRANYRYFVYRPNLPQVSIVELNKGTAMPAIDIHFRYSVNDAAAA